ncbi:hypothetical protein BH11ACT2_BH11ACT2_20910 [soil metagenome]
MTLDERYGRTRGSARRNRVIAIAVGAIIVLVFGAWALWAGPLASGSDIEVEDSGNVVESDSLVQVRYQLTTPADTAVKCAVQALDLSFGIVGWKIVSVPASSERTRVLHSEVRTSQRAVSGLIYRCWPA